MKLHGTQRSTVSLFAILFSTAAVVSIGACVAHPSGAGADHPDYAQRIVARYEQTDEQAMPAKNENTRSAGGPVALPVADQAALPRREALLTQTTMPSSVVPQDLLDEIPDPSEAERVFAKRLAEVERTSPEPRVLNSYRRMVEKSREYLGELAHQERVELGLAECIQRTLAGSYAIRADAYGPAISQTQLVEAEAAFDAVFFLNYSDDNTDQPVPTQLASGQSESRSASAGYRQLLPSGMRVETSLTQSRNFTDNSFVTINPAYNSTFTAQFTQPLMRGFGLDVNRAQIEIARQDLRISYATFVQRVRDTLLSVEQAYWALVRARRNAMIEAEAVAQNWVTWQNMEQRKEQDATPVEIANSRARWQSRFVRFLEAVKLVRDSEDRLKNLMNDPDYRLSDDVEIVTTELPLASPIALDQFAEVRAALDHRSEIDQARAVVEQARIQTHVAKNALLPQLDVGFNYRVQGLQSSGDESFDNLTTNRFRSFTITATFSVPIGNRAPRAAHRRARAQESQSIVRLKQATDAVVEEVNGAVRQLTFRYKQLEPQLDSVVSSARNLRSLQARAQAITPSFLETELSAVEQLSNNRNILLQVLTDYNTAIAQLEKAKGTLLEYNNVVISDGQTGP